MADHPIWFERVINPDLLGRIGPTVEILGPGIENELDPYAGIEHAAGIMASVLPYTDAVMDRAAKTVVIARTGIGLDGIDIGAATDRTIAVCNTPEGPTVSTAEHAMALILAIAKGLTRSAEALRLSEGNYYSHNKAIELDGKSLGLVGFGRIARRVGRSAQGLGMNVFAYDPFVSNEGFFANRVDSLDNLLALSDVVSIHVPLTTNTRLLFDQARFQRMRPGSILVNTSRGSVVDQNALIEALDSGQLFGAGLDVTEPEPLPPDHTLLHRPNVIVTPHIASGTIEGRQRIFLTALAQVLMVLNGQRPDHLVNPEVWPRIQTRLAEGPDHGQ
jgi:D-3-phosphoglycerate dehydrogenase